MEGGWAFSDTKQRSQARRSFLSTPILHGNKTKIHTPLPPGFQRSSILMTEGLCGVTVRSSMEGICRKGSTPLLPTRDKKITLISISLISECWLLSARLHKMSLWCGSAPWAGHDPKGAGGCNTLAFETIPNLRLWVLFPQRPTSPLYHFCIFCWKSRWRRTLRFGQDFSTFFFLP